MASITTPTSLSPLPFRPSSTSRTTSGPRAWMKWAEVSDLSLRNSNLHA